MTSFPHKQKHGVVVSPEASTNGETAQGDDEDDVSAEPAAGLAREPPHGRESVLGKDQFHLCPGEGDCH